MITSFSGPFYFLSNFYYHEPTKTVEHYYQAMKTTDPFYQIKILTAPSPSQAKRLGKLVPLRQDWDQIKLQVMKELIKLKFTNAILARQLIETGSQPLIEGNTWGDTYWGVCKGAGENHLGKILMEVRDELTLPQF